MEAPGPEEVAYERMSIMWEKGLLKIRRKGRKQRIKELVWKNKQREKDPFTNGEENPNTPKIEKCVLGESLGVRRNGADGEPIAGGG